MPVMRHHQRLQLIHANAERSLNGGPGFGSGHFHVRRGLVGPSASGAPFGVIGHRDVIKKSDQFICRLVIAEKLEHPGAEGDDNDDRTRPALGCCARKAGSEGVSTGSNKSPSCSMTARY